MSSSPETIPTPADGSAANVPDPNPSRTEPSEIGAMVLAETVHLAAGGTSVVLISREAGTPAVLYWGRRLADGEEQAMVAALDRPLPNATLDREAPIGLIPEVGDGFIGQPGIEGHRSDGSDYVPRFRVEEATVIDRGAQHDGDGNEPTGPATGCRWRLADEAAGLGLELEVTLDPASEVLALRATLTNRADDAYQVIRLAPTLSLPADASELLTLTGRWTAEFWPQRRQWPIGAWINENRRGRTSHDRVPVIFAGTDGFDETRGEVWGLHLGWSGNSRMVADRMSDGRRYLQASELLFPGEVELAGGASVTTPWVYGAHSSSGLGPLSHRFHRFVRGRDHHPAADRPRPVLLNTWEAVYFDHDLDTLKRLATRAASVGVERFVLDDGWFKGRDDDTSALGDWEVDERKYPDGLGPLIEHVRAEGMEFGIWFEPEMVNPDSDLYRAHPEWALQDDRYEMISGRNQLVLDLVNPAARRHVLDSMDRVLERHDVGYVKWDMNRDHTQPTHDGRAGSRNQTIALYDLLDELRRRHPTVEFESCSSGGARSDFEILARTERIWTSDCNDALDRQTIQRGFSMLFPPEVMGSHVGPPISHTTGRHHDLGFRVAAAFLGHFGIEWNLLEATDDECAELARTIEAHKRHRALIHSGDWWRLDLAEESASAMGVVAEDGSEAVFVYVRTATALASVPAPIRFAGLDPGRRYRPTTIPLPGRNRDFGRTTPAWVDEPVELTGRTLMASGLQPPLLDPEAALIIHLAEVGDRA